MEADGSRSRGASSSGEGCDDETKPAPIDGRQLQAPGRRSTRDPGQKQDHPDSNEHFPLAASGFHRWRVQMTGRPPHPSGGPTQRDDTGWLRRKKGAIDCSHRRAHYKIRRDSAYCQGLEHSYLNGPRLPPPASTNVVLQDSEAGTDPLRNLEKTEFHTNNCRRGLQQPGFFLSARSTDPAVVCSIAKGVTLRLRPHQEPALNSNGQPTTPPSMKETLSKPFSSRIRWAS